MFTKTKKVLGLAVEDNQILAAELHQSASRRRVIHAEAFPLPTETDFTNPEPRAAELQQFLRNCRFSARDVIIGFPAKWLLVKETEIPAVTGDALGNVVRLMAEREFSLEMSDLVLDYIVSGHSAADVRLLVMATLRRRMELIIDAVRTAGLNVLSVTSSALALFPISRPPGPAARYTLYLRPGYAEIVEQNGKGLRSVKHVSFATDDRREPDSVDSDLFRQLNNYFMLSSRRQDHAGKETLIVWDGAETHAISPETWQRELKQPFDIRNGFDVFDGSIADWQDTPETGRYVAPVFLAAAALQTEPVAIDFLNSKVTTRIKSSHKKPLLYAAIAVALVLMLGSAMAWSWYQDSRAIARMTAQIEEHKAEIEVVEELSRKISIVQKWYATRPRVLDCMLELTQAFPEQGTIWVSSLALREDMRGIITGKSQNESAFLEVLDKMNKNKVFSRPKMLYLRNTGRNSRDLAFAVDFLYTNGIIHQDENLDGGTAGQETEANHDNDENLDVVTNN